VKCADVLEYELAGIASGPVVVTLDVKADDVETFSKKAFGPTA
jgi:hypothetical protein